MSSFLDIHHHLTMPKSFTKPKPSKMFSRDRHNSGLYPTYSSNTDELKKVFNKFDSDKDGKISLEEFELAIQPILKALGEVTKEVEKIFEAVDLNGDEFIDFDEFVEVQKMGGGVKTADFQSAFKAFDKDNDGKITAGDLQDFLKSTLGENYSLEDCQKMVEARDSKGDGVIDLDEFMNMMTSTMTKH